MSQTRSLESLAASTLTTFEGINQRVFAGDPAANPRLKVEVVQAAVVADTPTLILITPWTLNGMAFPPDERFPTTLKVGGKEYPVFEHSLEELGPYHSVNLMGDVSTLKSPESARALARSLSEPFAKAVADARGRQTVPDPDRRNLLLGRVSSEH